MPVCVCPKQGLKMTRRAIWAFCFKWASQYLHSGSLFFLFFCVWGQFSGKFPGFFVVFVSICRQADTGRNSCQLHTVLHLSSFLSAPPTPRPKGCGGRGESSCSSSFIDFLTSWTHRLLSRSRALRSTVYVAANSFSTCNVKNVIGAA